MKSKLLNEVISDAKAVKETAFQTAINALREEFAPTMSRMLSRKIAEEEGLEDEDETMAPPTDFPTDDVTTEEEFPTEEFPGSEMGDEEDADLEEILRELEGDSEEEEFPAAPADPTAAAPVAPAAVPPAPVAAPAPAPAVEEPFSDLPAEEEEDFTNESLDSLIREMEDELSAEEEPPVQGLATEVRQLRKENAKLKANIKEAYQAITVQKNTISEVNLLNAKLMYLQKITTKHKTLSENVKVQILEALDRAVNIREVKLVYSTIAKHLSPTKTATPKPNRLQENASRTVRAVPASSAQGKSEFTFVPRWQQLANITKK